MQRASLGELQGVGKMVSRPSPSGDRAYRGSFAFRSSDEEAVIALQSSRRLVTYEGPIDGEPSAVKVSVVAVSMESGMAYLEGSTPA